MELNCKMSDKVSKTNIKKEPWARRVKREITEAQDLIKDQKVLLLAKETEIEESKQSLLTLRDEFQKLQDLLKKRKEKPTKEQANLCIELEKIKLELSSLQTLADRRKTKSDIRKKKLESYKASVKSLELELIEIKRKLAESNKEKEYDSELFEYIKQDLKSITEVTFPTI